jgi:hypothetical protein
MAQTLLSPRESTIRCILRVPHPSRLCPSRRVGSYAPTPPSIFIFPNTKPRHQPRSQLAQPFPSCALRSRRIHNPLHLEGATLFAPFAVCEGWVLRSHSTVRFNVSLLRPSPSPVLIPSFRAPNSFAASLGSRASLLLENSASLKRHWRLPSALLLVSSRCNAGRRTAALETERVVLLAGWMDSRFKVF